MAKIVTVTGVERCHEGQDIYDELTVSPDLPQEWLPGSLYVEKDTVKIGDEISVDKKTERVKIPGTRNKQGRDQQIPLSYLEITRTSDGMLITRKQS